MADTWAPDSGPQPPLGEPQYELLADDEFEIVDAADELCVVPITMQLNDDQRKMIRFLDGLCWSGLTIEKKRNYYAGVLRDVVKKLGGGR